MIDEMNEHQLHRGNTLLFNPVKKQIIKKKRTLSKCCSQVVPESKKFFQDDIVVQKMYKRKPITKLGEMVR